MVKFMTLHPDGRFSDIRNIEQSDIAKCPHAIFDPRHYREDSTCKCNDPDEVIMKEWGYRWDEGEKQWV